MQIEELKTNFDSLQKQFGDPKLSSIYGAGCLQNPDVCFVFMNPTGKNIAANPQWHGLRAPWIGTKNVWKLFSKLNLISSDLFQSIQTMHATEWTPDFAQLIYQDITDHRIYITNLSKSTQTDARALSNNIFRKYLPGFHQEISIIKPKCIIAFGNQVSSIILNEVIKVSQTRKKGFSLIINKSSFSVYPTYYPVGQGMRNIDKAVEDIRWIIDTF